MKKVLSIIVVLSLIVSFAGCANTSNTAKPSLSVSRNEFLFDLQKGLQRRWDMVEADTKTDKTIEEEISFNAKLVEVEYKYLEKYFDCNFNDSEFQTIADEYLSALKGQYDITRNSYDITDFTTKWSEYYSKRTNLIRIFYNQYGLNVDVKYYPTLYKINIDANKKDIPSETLVSLQGEWECTSYKWDCIIIDGLTVSFVRYYNDAKTRVSKATTTFLSTNDEMTLVLLDNHLRTNYSIEITGTGNIEVKDFYTNEYYEYKKISDNTSFPEPMKDPCIGMSKKELENSTWGEPATINKDTTVGGEKEQWVYDRPFNRKAYIYVSNGIVTEIQEK